jgi:hypothetical protein
MRCEEFEQRLAGLTAGRLRDPEEDACLRHAATCAKCTRLLETARGDCRVEPPNGLLESVLEQTTGRACGDARELLCDFVDGTLPHGEDALLKGHLRVCPRCRALADSLEISHVLLAELAEADPGPGFTASVLEETNRLPQRPEQSVDGLLAFVRSLFLRPRFALEAAYVGALLLFGLYGLIPGEPLQPKFFSAGPTVTEMHQKATRFTSAAVADLSNRSRSLEILASAWTKTTGETLRVYSATTFVELEGRYAGVCTWLAETWQNARFRAGREWNELTDGRPGS